MSITTQSHLNKFKRIDGSLFVERSIYQILSYFILSLALFSNGLAFAYDNPAGTTVLGGVTTSDTTVTNEGTLGDSGVNPATYSLISNGNGVSITNSGNMTGAQGVNITGSNTTFTNLSAGIIQSYNGNNGITFNQVQTGVTINNYGLITSGSVTSGTDWAYGIVGEYIQSSVNNFGTGTISITGNNTAGILGSYSSITNSGAITITGDNSNGVQTYQGGGAGYIGTLTNTGYIAVAGVGSFGIRNDTGNIIAVLNNRQGGNSSSAASTPLTYTGVLPTNYNIIINSKTQYGQLVVTSGTGTTTFGIYAGGVSGVAASTLSKGTYSSVLSGLTLSNFYGAKSGNYNGFTWTLNNSSATIWDLIVTGASNDDTQKSIVATAASLQNTFALQNAVLANSFSYDCNTFGANNVCVSAGGRNTAVQAANGLNNTSALLIAAYRPHPNYRIGAYADQNLSVSNAGSTVNLGNNTPLIGLFGAWNQRLDGTGTEVKVSAAYGQKNTTVTRQVVGTSEPGSGSSQLNSQGAQVTAKYGFTVTDKAIVSPYVGVRYTQNNMGGYTEGTSTTVTAPLTYSALNTNATTALAGVGTSYKVIPTVTTFASAGVETDTNTANGSYSGTSSSITGLTPVNFNANPVKTRPTAMLGASYEIEKNQRLGITGIYRQESYQAVSTTTVMATYTVGL